MGSVEEVKVLFEEFLAYPVNSRCRGQKRGRVERFLRSRLAGEIFSSGFEELVGDLMRLWVGLADVLGALWMLRLWSSR